MKTEMKAEVCTGVREIVQRKTKEKEPPVLSAKCVKLTQRINMTDISKTLREKRFEDGMYRNKFASQAYSAGGGKAREAQAAAEVVKEFSGLQYRRASALWEEMAE